jgi:hypothetical protein
MISHCCWSKPSWVLTSSQHLYSLIIEIWKTHLQNIWLFLSSEALYDMPITVLSHCLTHPRKTVPLCSGVPLRGPSEHLTLDCLAHASNYSASRDGSSFLFLFIPSISTFQVPLAPPSYIMENVLGLWFLQSGFVCSLIQQILTIAYWN